jgi:hypothetical protein
MMIDDKAQNIPFTLRPFASYCIITGKVYGPILAGMPGSCNHATDLNEQFKTL